MGVLGSKAMRLSRAKPIIQGVAKLGPAGAVIGGGWRATAGAINGDGTEVAKGGLMIPAALGGMHGRAHCAASYARRRCQR